MIYVFSCTMLNFLSLQHLDGNASPLLRTSQDERQNRIEGRTRHDMSIVALNGFAVISLVGIATLLTLFTMTIKNLLNFGQKNFGKPSFFQTV